MVSLRKYSIAQRLCSLLVLVTATTMLFAGHVSSAWARSASGVADSSVPMGVRVYNKALEVFNKADHVHYQHQAADATQQVVFTGDTCDAECDCSGFVCYVLNAVTPEHYEALEKFAHRSGHSQAKTFVHFFSTLNTTEAQEGWIGLKSYTQLRRGDLIAWEKAIASESVIPESLEHPKKGNTGHVMIVESPPEAPQSVNINGADVRFVGISVIDSSSVDHFSPERLPPQAHQQYRDGVGLGVVRLVLDSQDHVIGYWEGTYWNEGGKKITKPSYTDTVAFARLVPEKPAN